MPDVLTAPQTERRSSRRASMRNRARRWAAVTAVDFDGQKVRIARVKRRRGRLAIVRVIDESLPLDVDPSDRASVGRFLRDAFSRHRLPRGPVVFGVPRHAAILRHFDFPDPGDSDELALMVRFAFQRELPFPPEDGVIDFTVREAGPIAHAAMGSSAGDKSSSAASASVRRLRVLAAAIRRQVVEESLELARHAGLKLVALGLRSYANVRCAELFAVGGSESTGALVSVRTDEAIVDIVENRDLAFSRSMSYTREGDEVSDDAFDGLITEIARSVRSYEAHGGHRKAAWVAVAGDSGLEERVAKRLSEVLGVDCQVLDPARHSNTASRERWGGRGSIAAIGLCVSAIDRRGLPFDFLHPKKPKPRNRGRWIKRSLALSAVISGLVLVFGARHRMLEAEHRVAETLEQEINARAPLETPWKRRVRDARAINSWASADPRWLEHWALLSHALPESRDFRITSFVTGQNGTIQLKALARSPDVLQELPVALEDAGYKVKPLPVTPAIDPHGYAYQTKVDLVVPPGMDPSASLARLAAKASSESPGESGTGASSDESSTAAAPSRNEPSPSVANADSNADSNAEPRAERERSRRTSSGGERRASGSRSPRGERPVVVEADR